MITASVDAGGLIVPSDQIVVLPGGYASSMIDPQPAYAIDEVVLDRVSLGTRYHALFTDVAPDRAWAAGDGGMVLHTTDGGVSWTIQTSGRSKNFTDVLFLDANIGWAVGDGMNPVATWLSKDAETPCSPCLLSNNHSCPERHS